MTFQERLQAAMADGNLTVADLARWFERPHPTVLGWAKGGGLGGAPRDRLDVSRRLTRLERLIRSGKGLPVPRLAPQARKAYLAALARQA